MKVHWTNRASLDLVRLEEFLSSKSQRVVQALISAPNRLLEHPRAGERIEDTGDVVFHMREER